jgi:hypothetical protein
MENNNNFPTEVVDLPSQGLLYSKESPLSSGKIEMKYMTAKEEDILTNQNYIQKGVVIDKLLQALIVDKNINYGDLLEGDKNALLIAARILGYGKDYEFQYLGEKVVVDLSTLKNLPLKTDIVKEGKNEFEFKCPATENTLTFKLLTHSDQTKIENELEGLKKIFKEGVPEMSTRLKYMILSVDGNTDRAVVRKFVDERFLARDSRVFRKYINEIQPDVDLRFFPENGPEEGAVIPIGIGFLWPDAGI